MTKAVLIGIVLLIMATAAFFVAFKFMKRSDDHEIYSGSIAEELDKYVILEINNEDRWVYIKSTPDSPFSYNQ